MSQKIDFKQQNIIDTVNALKGEWPEFTRADASVYHPVLEYHFLGCAHAIVRIKGGKNVMLDEFRLCVKMLEKETK